MGLERFNARDAPAPEAPTMPLPAGSLVGERYRVESRIAEGGMGCVYRVVDERTGNELALKRLRGSSREHVALFEREYRTLAGIQHPRIIRAFDYGVDALGPYYTMELAPGRDLHKLAPLPTKAALGYLRDVATCLGLLHTRRLLHRDVTPHNVRVLDNGDCKLIDFGALTSFGVPELVVGTPPCIPPEALERVPLDQRADVFSFGALLYWTLTRKHAFPAGHVEELRAAWRKRPAPPSSLAPGISSPLDAFVLRLLHVDPQLRPASMAEVVERLTVLGGLPPEDSATQHALAESYLVHTSCVGREPELRRLHELATRLQDKHGHCALLVGPQGVGRSRLLQELSVQAQLLGLACIQLDAGARPEPYGAVITLAEQVIAHVPAAHQHALGEAAAFAQLDAQLAGRLSSAAGARRSEISGDWRAHIQQLVLHLVQTACMSRPLLLLIDDIKQADDASLAVFASLAALSKQVPLTLVGSAGPQPVGARSERSWRSLCKQGETIEVAPLSLRHMTLLTRSLFGDAPNLPRFSEWLNEQAGGLPLHYMTLIRRMHASGQIRYLDGLWTLPAERPALLPPDDLAALLAERVEGLSAPARALAEALAVQQGALSHARCSACVTDANPLQLLDELVHAEVLDDSLQGYHFTHSALRELLLRRAEPERLRRLHEACAERVLAGATQASLTRARIDAGWHLLQAGHEERGADLLATVAYDAEGVLVAYADLQVVAPALEAALRVYTTLGRPLHQRMPLMAALAQAGYYVDRAWGERYADAALAATLELSGLTLAARLRPYLGQPVSLLAGLGYGWLRCQFRPRDTSSFLKVLTQLFGVATTATAAAAMSLDTRRAETVAATLAPFLSLPSRATAVGISEYCAALSAIGRDDPAVALAGWCKLLSRFEDPRCYRLLPRAARQLYIGGLWFARGVFESFRDGHRALEAADALDHLDLKLYNMIASALRSIHYANRGDLNLARVHREQVDVHAIQVGSAWQVELWEPAALILVHTQVGDLTEMLRVSDRLCALAQTYPSLALHAQLAKLALTLVREDDGALQREASASDASTLASLDAALAVLEREPPRSFIGWGALCGFVGRALNFLGRHGEAKQLCERALSHLTEADRAFVTLYLNIELELAAADAALGAMEPAKARLEALMRYHAASDNPLTRGRIHETYVRIAAHAQQWPVFREHVEAMRAWYSRTGTTSLIARVERLQGLDPELSHRSSRADGAREALARPAENDATFSEGSAWPSSTSDVTHSFPKSPMRRRSKL